MHFIFNFQQHLYVHVCLRGCAHTHPASPSGEGQGHIHLFLFPWKHMSWSNWCPPLMGWGKKASICGISHVIFKIFLQKCMPNLGEIWKALSYVLISIKTANPTRASHSNDLLSRSIWGILLPPETRNNCGCHLPTGQNSILDIKMRVWKQSIQTEKPHEECMCACVHIFIWMYVRR